MSLEPSYTWHDGFAMPMGFPVDAFRSALSYAPEPSDFFIATYPKCGTTWVQNIVYLLAHGGEPLPASASMGEAIPHLEEVGGDVVRNLSSPRYIKTHLPFGLAPKSDSARYLYVARNPFDCAVSFFHHTRGFVKHYDFADGSFADYFECFVSGRVDFGDYFDNVRGWLPRSSEANVRILTYEAMQADVRGAIRTIADFMQAECADDESVIDAVVEHSSFASMSRDQQRWSSRRPEGMPAFVRKGVVGDWVNYFSTDQCYRLLERSDAIAADVELEALWPDVYAAARRYAQRPRKD